MRSGMVNREGEDVDTQPIYLFFCIRPISYVWKLVGPRSRPPRDIDCFAAWVQALSDTVIGCDKFSTTGCLNAHTRLISD